LISKILSPGVFEQEGQEEVEEVQEELNMFPTPHQQP